MEGLCPTPAQLRTPALYKLINMAILSGYLTQQKDNIRPPETSKELVHIY